MKNILIITQKVDENDDLLGFFVGWLREFSKKFDKIFVITLGKGEYNLPANVFIYSLGKERGSNKISRFFNFYKLLFKLVPKSKGIFSHMSPIFAISSWPVAFLFGKKVFLWYLHRSLTFRLKIAEKLCSKILTADKGSLTIKSRKIIELGHGIDIEKFRTRRDWNDTLENFIEFAGFVPYSQIADYYKEADIFINLAPKGGLDKAVLEAMAAGCLTLVANEVFKKYFGDFSQLLIFRYGNPDDLSQKIENLLELSKDELNNISNFLQGSVERSHNLFNTVDKISELFN
ncbi:MAG: hypothetical protein G01um10142_559 [Parcubacteria group bacterium Gr01-1014_2]|nr:MAG: hypothetical protein G01um10142_559 [Parcubacteria group bacterium Gr01-1014_2]